MVFLNVSKLFTNLSSVGAISYCLLTPLASHAQVSPDSTLNTRIEVNNQEQTFSIHGGVRSNTINPGDSNLFFSFQEFSLSEGWSAIFADISDVENIISRVTGSTGSKINGLIQVDGDANLFLLNPNGITFGPKAALAINGSFIASTANGIQFENGNFSVDDLQTNPSLLVSVPIGLQFGNQAASIRNEAELLNNDSFNQTTALIGGDIVFDQGILSTLSFGPSEISVVGNVELGSVVANSYVELEQTDEGWRLAYEPDQQYQDIVFMHQSGMVGESIQLQGRDVSLNKGTAILGVNINIEASDLVTVNDSSFVEAFGGIGNIKIEAERLILNNNGRITAASPFINELGGNINLIISDSINLDGESLIDNGTAGRGTGTINIHTERLTVQGGSQINSSTQAESGKAGNLIIIATESILLSGQADQDPSGLFSNTQEFGSGDAGDIKVETGQLIVQDGAQISAFTINEGGDGGDIILDADFIELKGTSTEDTSSFPSGIFTFTSGPGDAGLITIETEQLVVQDSAAINTASISTDSNQEVGNASNLNINAVSISLEDQGSLIATTDSGRGGNITLNVQDILLLREAGQISTTAGLEEAGGDGGNITINAGFVLAVPDENSDIIANAFSGTGGTIDITSNQLLGFIQQLDPLTNDQLRNNASSDISASSQIGQQGAIIINNLAFDPNQGLVELPNISTSPSVQRGCSIDAVGESSFTVTGRGGLPSSPTSILSRDQLLTDLGPDNTISDLSSNPSI